MRRSYAMHILKRHCQASTGGRASGSLVFHPSLQGKAARAFGTHKQGHQGSQPLTHRHGSSDLRASEVPSLPQEQLCVAASLALDQRNVAKASDLMLHILDRPEFQCDDRTAALMIRVIDACSNEGRVKEAIKHYRNSRSKEIHLGQGSYLALLKATAIECEIEDMIQVISEMQSNDVAITSEVLELTAEPLILTGNSDLFRSLFAKRQDLELPNKVVQAVSRAMVVRQEAWWIPSKLEMSALKEIYASMESDGCVHSKLVRGLLPKPSFDCLSYTELNGPCGNHGINLYDDEPTEAVVPQMRFVDPSTQQILAVTNESEFQWTPIDANLSTRGFVPSDITEQLRNSKVMLFNTDFAPICDDRGLEDIAPVVAIEWGKVLEAEAEHNTTKIEDYMSMDPTEEEDDVESVDDDDDDYYEEYDSDEEDDSEHDVRVDEDCDNDDDIEEYNAGPAADASSNSLACLFYSLGAGGGECSFKIPDITTWDEAARGKHKLSIYL